MGECNLDWKKVFKEILGPKSSSQKVAFTDEYKEEFGSNVTSSEVENCIESHSSLTGNANKDTSKTITPNNESDKVTQWYMASTSASKEKFVRKVLPSKQSSTCIVQDQMNSSNVNKGDVPKWDSAFKVILGSTKDVQEREVVESVIKKPELQQKQNVPVKNKTFYKKKVETYKNFKVKNYVDEEEKKIREIFARSRTFKLECPVSNLNDLAGCGVDIFKSGKIMHSSIEVKVPEELEMQDDSCTDYSELSVPVSGLIANIKPLTREEILNADCVPLTEIWDDDFLF